MTELETQELLFHTFSKFIGRVINDELYAAIDADLTEVCDKVLCSELNNPPERTALGYVRAEVVVDGVHYILDIEGARAVPVKLISDAKIEAGARALATIHILVGSKWSFDEFSTIQQQAFRAKARAVLIAAEKAE